MLRSVAETLIATCISNPSSGSLGGTAVSQTIHSRKRTTYVGRRQTGKISLHSWRPAKETEEISKEMLQVAFPPTFEIAVYLQPPFRGAADTTCQWGVVASHQGDVRQCPASSAPIRPPERRLGANTTITGNWTGPMIYPSRLDHNSSSTSTATSDLLLTSVVGGRALH